MDEKRPLGQHEVAAKTPTKEDEFFRKEEAAARERAEAARKERERAEQKELHYMRCPKCGAELVEEAHESIMIDKCPECQGLWLDHGELEKINSKEKGFLSRWFS